MTAPNGRAWILPDRAVPLAAYPHLREANGFLFVSGLSARRPDGSVAGVERAGDGRVIRDVRAQTEGVIENLRAVLQAAGADLDHLVSVTTYLVAMTDYAGYNEVYNRHFTAETGPVRTTVGVRELPGPDLLIEMTAVAVAPR